MLGNAKGSKKVHFLTGGSGLQNSEFLFLCFIGKNNSVIFLPKEVTTPESYTSTQKVFIYIYPMKLENLGNFNCLDSL